MAEPLKDPSVADDQDRVQAARRILRPRRLVIAAVLAVCACVVAAVALASSGSSGTSALRATPTKAAEPPPLKSHPKVVRAVGPGESAPSDGVSAGNGTVRDIQSDEEIRNELTSFRRHLTGVGVARGAVPSVASR